MRRKLSLFAVLAVLALIVAACGNSDEDTTTTAASTETTTATTAAPDTTEATDTTEAMADTGELGLPIIDPLDVETGDVAIAGSSTVFPLSTAVMSQWVDEGGPEYAIDSIGSGGGFERFCTEGTSDISNASRPIEADEITNCESIDREPIEIRVGTDALSLVISNGNNFAQELTFEEIAAAFSLPAGSTWADVNPDFPAHPIQTFTPGTDSGTFDYFNEEIYPDDETSPILSGGAQIVGEDDNLTVRGVADDRCTEGDLSSTCAIGYFGYAYYQQNADELQAVSVDGGDGPVLPSADSVNEATYPLARPLFMYTAPSVIQAKPQVAEFIAYYLENVNALIGEVGYFPAPAAALQEAADHIKAAAGW
jgi:phosphate transport system substrate-binding protein